VRKFFAAIGLILTTIFAIVFGVFRGQKDLDLRERVGRIDELDKRITDKQRNQTDSIIGVGEQVQQLGDKINGNLQDNRKITDGLKGISESISSDTERYNRAATILERIRKRNEQKDNGFGDTE